MPPLPACIVVLNHATLQDFNDRPVVFLASCFGGLLLSKVCVPPSLHVGTSHHRVPLADGCQALHRASERNSRYKNILDQTVGIAFIGVPFRGSHTTLYNTCHLRVSLALHMGAEANNNLVQSCLLLKPSTFVAAWSVPVTRMSTWAAHRPRYPAMMQADGIVWDLGPCAPQRGHPAGQTPTTFCLRERLALPHPHHAVHQKPLFSFLWCPATNRLLHDVSNPTCSSTARR